MTKSDEFYVRAHPGDSAEAIAEAIGEKLTAKLRRRIEQIQVEERLAASDREAEREKAEVLAEVIHKSVDGKATYVAMTAAGASRKVPPDKPEDVPSRHLRGAVHKIDLPKPK